jgi:Putative phage metallopeptidase
MNSITIPADDDFGGEDWITGPETQGLHDLAALLIEREPRFVHLSEEGPGGETDDGEDLPPIRIRYAWRRKGPTSQGLPVMAKCQKMSGLAKHYGVTDFTIWLSADLIRQREWTDDQLAACLWHELRHIGFDDDKASIIGHDYEIFSGELEKWGAWRQELEDLVVEARQLDLPGFAA